jgi:DNA polymerase-3 subunit delta'
MIFQSLPWHQSALLEQLHDAQRLPHALLLRGASGIGKTRYAQALAAALLCEAPLDSGLACGHCLACGWVAADTHPDLRQLTRLVDDDGKQANEIKIDQVRALSEFLGVGSHRGGRRLVLIDPEAGRIRDASPFVFWLWAAASLYFAALTAARSLADRPGR